MSIFLWKCELIKCFIIVPFIYNINKNMILNIDLNMILNLNLNESESK